MVMLTATESSKAATKITNTIKTREEEGVGWSRRIIFISLAAASHWHYLNGGWGAREALPATKQGHWAEKSGLLVSVSGPAASRAPLSLSQPSCSLGGKPELGGYVLV